MARYLLDSVIVIDHFNGVEAATEFLAAHGRDCVISVILIFLKMAEEIIENLEAGLSSFRHVLAGLGSR